VLLPRHFLNDDHCMAFTLNSLRHAVYRLALVQIALVVATALFFYLKQGSEFSLAALYGGAIPIVSTLMSAWRLTVATRILKGVAGEDALPGAIEFYKTAFFRIVLTIALLALGLGGLKLAPMALIIGFVAGQLGHFFVPLHQHRA